MPEEGRPVAQAEAQEFNQERATTGLDGKQGINVFVISGSAMAAGGGGGPSAVTTLSGSVTNISGEVVVAQVSGQTVVAQLASGTSIAASVSGQPVGVSGQTVVAQISGQTVVAQVSGQKVLTSGDVAIISGQPVGVSGATVVAQVSGQTVVAQISGQTVVAGVSGQVIYLAASGGPIITAGSGSLMSGAVPLHVLIVSGSVAGTGGGTASGTAVQAFISGQPIVLTVSGGTAPSAGGGADLSKTPLAVLVVSGSVTAAAGTSTTTLSGSVTDVSGEVLYLAASGGPIITAGSGSLQSGAVPLHVLVISGSVVTPVSVTVSGFQNVTSLSGSVTNISGATVIGQVSGQTVVAQISGQLVLAVLETSGGFFPGASLGLDNKQALNVFVVSGGAMAAGGGAGTTITTLSGSVTNVSGNAVLISGQEVSPFEYLPVLTSGEELTTVVVSGAVTPGRVDQVGRQVVRIDRAHLSGGYATYHQSIARLSGATVIHTPFSGNSLRIKWVQDTLYQFSGQVIVGYRFSGQELNLVHALTNTVLNFGMNLIGGQIQGGPGAPLFVVLDRTLASGVYFTIAMEEVFSGAVF